jgi:hypothetical protein
MVTLPYERPRRIQTRHSTRFSPVLFSPVPRHSRHHAAHYPGHNGEYYWLRKSRGLCPRCPRPWSKPGVCTHCRLRLVTWRATSVAHRASAYYAKNHPGRRAA